MESKHYRRAAETLINTGNCISQNGFKRLWESDTFISWSMLERSSLKF